MFSGFLNFSQITKEKTIMQDFFSSSDHKAKKARNVTMQREEVPLTNAIKIHFVAVLNHSATLTLQNTMDIILTELYIGHCFWVPAYVLSDGI